MKIKKNWLQFKEPQAPSTQSTEKLSDEKLSVPSLTNDQDNIEVLPRLNNEKLSDDKSDNDKSEDDESDDEESDDDESDNDRTVNEGSTDEELVDKLLNFIKRKILKERGINIPLPCQKRNNTAANKTVQIIKSEVANHSAKRFD